LGRALALKESIETHHPESLFKIYLVDEALESEIPDSVQVNIINANALGIPNYVTMTEKYNITEMNTAIKPFAFLHAFSTTNCSSVVYLDPDTFIYSRFEEVEECLSAAKPLIVTPHILQPDSRNVTKNQIFLQFGTFNLGFLAIYRTEESLKLLEWWGWVLADHCVIDLPNGLFVDQKWADLFSSFLDGVFVLRHPGYNVAYWNLHERNLVLQNNFGSVNQMPLRFLHFSGLEKTKPSISRHSYDLDPNEYRVFLFLKDKYLEILTLHSDDYYANLSYSFGWNGNSGENLHTPKPLLETSPNFEKTSTISSGRIILRRMNYLSKAVRLFFSLKDGKLKAIKKFGKLALSRDLNRIKQVLRTAGDTAVQLEKQTGHGFSSFSMKRVLVIDWALPNPERDAASVTQTELLKIFSELGHQVYFLPTNLLRDPNSESLLEDIGIKVISYPMLLSVESWLELNAKFFGQIWLFRGPVSYPYIDTIMSNSPLSRIVFYTVDLHYLRELREAKLQESSTGIENALKTKKLELELISKCDATIVLSKKEIDVLRESINVDKVHHISLIFEQLPLRTGTWANRKNLLFIGSFDHSPNWDGLKWFLESSYPTLKRLLPEIEINIVGPNPPSELIAIGDADQSIHVHGQVVDISGFLENSRISIAPLLYGAGVKGKVGQSLMNGLPVVATSIATEGMELVPNRDIIVADESIDFAESVFKLYNDELLWENVSHEGWKAANELFSAVSAKTKIEKLISGLEFSVSASPYVVDCVSFEQRLQTLNALGADYVRRDLIEESLSSKDESTFSIQAFCVVCQIDSEFLVSFMYSNTYFESGAKSPNWREHLQCSNCKFVTRLRFLLDIWTTKFSPSANSKIYLTEAVTEMYSYISSKFDEVIGSEFIADGLTSGTLVNGIRHEDIQATSLPSEHFDYVISCDVLEHVYDYMAALREFYRILKVGGSVLITVPFDLDSIQHVHRAYQENNIVTHVLPPEYHGNPINPDQGSFCWRYYGWEILEELKSIGFSDARLVAGWSVKFAYLGSPQIVIQATK
jgi:hypothetical protein